MEPESRERSATRTPDAIGDLGVVAHRFGSVANDTRFVTIAWRQRDVIVVGFCGAPWVDSGAALALGGVIVKQATKRTFDVGAATSRYTRADEAISGINHVR